MANALLYIFIQTTDVDPFSIKPADITIADPRRANTILQDENSTWIETDISIYQADTGGYVIVLPDNENRSLINGAIPYSIPLTMFFILLIAVFLTNLALTKVVTRRIMTSINILKNGVHEISDGNLTYRIEYNTGDEFDTVCADFNEMALRLSDMVNQRQIDEDNRKELIAGIAHDLRTPLTSIKAYIEGLRKGVASTPEMQEKYLDTIQNKTEDIEYIISQLFLFTKMDIGEFPFNFETVDIGVELENMVAGLADEYRERGLNISLKEKTQGVFVSIDTVQFRNVIQNILDNSVKYGNKDHGRAEISCHSSESNVTIAIKDNGPGVPEEKLAKIFEVFYRNDESRNTPGKGSGLGLAIAAKIIERLKGSIIAGSAPEGGLDIAITLPMVTTTTSEK
jgi:signal transduction histidine kinase